MRTVGLNVFAFSDLRGVERSASRRARWPGSRQQLEAVVAHEFADILSGSYVTVTVSCLLFLGIYCRWPESLDGRLNASSDTDAASAVVLMIPLRGWLWVMQLASSVVNAAISRQREWQADLAAVRYTRDPAGAGRGPARRQPASGRGRYIPRASPRSASARRQPGRPAVAGDPHPADRGAHTHAARHRR